MTMTIIKGMESADSITEPLLKIAIAGEAGVGKSWLAATAPKPVLDLDFDGRKSSLIGKSEVFVKSYVDVDTTRPNAVADMESDLNSFDYAKQKGEEIPATFVIDSATYFRKFAEAELMKQQTNLGRELRVGPAKIRISQGWDIVNANKLYLEYVINRLSVLGNVICIFHTQDEKDNTKSTADKKTYTGRMTIQPQYLSSVLSIFNDVWLVDVNYKNERFVQTGISTEFIGKCSLKGLNPLSEAPDIEAMLVKHRLAIGATKK